MPQLQSRAGLGLVQGEAGLAGAVVGVAEDGAAGLAARDPWDSSQWLGVRGALRGWFAGVARVTPWRLTRDPYAILVSEVMLQQTRVEAVLAGGWFERWMAAFPDAAALARAPEPQVLALWQGLGYYNRARNLQRTAQRVMATGGVWPGKAAGLRELPGVGDYTAAAVASLAFGEAVATVDGNVLRVLARVSDEAGRIDRAEPRARLGALAQAWLDPANPGDHNAALMELGQRVCTPRAPRCGQCPVRIWCRCVDPATRPVKAPRRAVVELEERALWVTRASCRGPELLLAQEQGTRRRDFWRLPLRSAAEVEALGGAELLRLKYAITHHRVDYRIFEASARLALEPGERWWQLAEIGELPLTAPARKVVARLADGG